MRRAAFALLATLAAGAAASSATAAVRAFPVGGFDRITTSVPFDVHVRTGAAPSVHADGPQDALDRLRVEVHGGALVISNTPGSWWSGWRHNQRAVIDVTVPTIVAASLSGPGNLTVDRVRTPQFEARLLGPGDIAIGTIEADRLNLTLSGPGDITAAGRVGTANIMLSGPGDIRAAKVMARTATVLLSGPGDLAISASDTVDGRITGPGDIWITGGARCNITKHGPGDVHCR